MHIQYGKCPCGGTYENRTVELRMTVEDEPLVISDIPQGACPACGSRVYKLDVLECIEATIKRSLIPDSELGRGE
jgi:YgiT-type zinc finger domain-containing protein